MKEFIFNSYGVCTNPNIESFEIGKCRCSMETASIGDKWIVGYLFIKSANGSGSPCTANNGRLFQSEKEARKYAAQQALDFFNEDHYTDDNSHYFANVPKDVFKKLQEIIKPAQKELYLFDNF